MIDHVLAIYLSGTAGLLFIGTRLPPEARLERILIAAFAWPVGLSLEAWRTWGR